VRDAGRHGSHQGYERGEMADASCMALHGLPLLHVHVGRARASRCAYHLPAGKLRESVLRKHARKCQSTNVSIHAELLGMQQKLAIFCPRM